MTHRCRCITLALLLALVPALVFAQDEGRRRHRGGAHITIGRSYTLPAGDTLAGPLVVIGGRTTLNGTVEDDVLAIGGRIDVGPTAVIEGDLHTVGGRVEIDPAARVEGDVERADADWGHVPFGVNAGRRFWSWFAAWATLFRLALVFVAGILIAMVAPGALRTIGHQAATAPGWSFVAGAATELLATPAIILLCLALVITIVGIAMLPAVPLLVGALVLLWIVGFTAVASLVGRAVQGNRAERPVIDFVLGFFALSGVTLVARILSVGPGWLLWGAIPLGAAGIAIEYVAWTVGLGAALLVLVNRQRGLVPPPLPPRTDDAPASAPA